MKLVTLRNGTPDGQLAVASKDLRSVIPAADIAPTLQAALDEWDRCEPLLRALARQVDEGGHPAQQTFDAERAMAPLPRAWQWLDASAFESHAELMSTVFKMDPPSRDLPLMYQGMSNHFYGPHEDVPFPSEADGIDFEGEFAVIVGEVPMGTSAAKAADYIRLVVQLNDWSLRAIAPVEMKTGFGWVQAKPPCSVAPAAVTPDELGDAWRDCRVDLDLAVFWNGDQFGRPNGYAMGFSFADLIAHAARTRTLCAGTIIGSGTVSNANYREVGSSCIAERRGIEMLDAGAARTPFMSFGETVRMEARSRSDAPLFGRIEQKVVRA